MAAKSTKTIQIGLNKTHYAVYDEEQGTYGTPVALVGSVKMSRTVNSNDSSFYADDGLFWSDTSVTDSDVELEVAFLPDEFMTDVMGQTKDSNGLVIEGKDDAVKQIALLFEVGSNKSPRRYAYYNVTPSIPDEEHNTRSDSSSPDTVTLKLKIGYQDFTVGGVETSVDKTHVTKGTDTAKAWDKWFEQVVVPGASLE